MFNSTVLDVAIGLIFVFMAVSLAASAILEAVAGIINWRSRTLLNGIRDLLNDPNLQGLAGQLYRHALINPRNDGTGTTPAQLRENAPAYIDPKQFANALIDILNSGMPVPPPGQQPAAQAPAAVQPPAADAPQPKPLPPEAGHPGRMTTGDSGSIGRAIDYVVPYAANPQINSLLHGIARRADFDLDQIKAEIGRWFDNAMDRVSGVYKRWTQLWNFLIALALAGVLNISAIHVAKILWQQPIDTRAIDSTATKMPDAANAFNTLDRLPLPIGWSHYKPAIDKDPSDTNPAHTCPSSGGQPTASTGTQEIQYCTYHLTAADWVEIVFGWLITAVAALFGAPFWFDLLQQIIRLKGAGPSPQEKKDGTAAAQ